MEAVWTLVESNSQPQLQCEMHDRQPENREHLDGWTMRDRFFGLRRNQSDLLKFLQWAGRFPNTPLLDGSAHRYDMLLFWKWQDLFREALVRKNVDWKKGFGSFPTLFIEERLSDIQFLLEGKKSKAIVQAACGLYAIGATVEIDLVSGAEFKWCARPDCPTKIFKPTSRHRTKYCSYDCAHLQSIRNSRGTIVASEGEL